MRTYTGYLLTSTPPDYASVLYTVPSLEFAKCLVLPPKPFSPYLTVFEVY